MKAVQKHLSLVLVLLSCAAAQNGTGTATVQNVTVAREGIDLRIEIMLSAPVTPTVDTAENPHRILLDFPDTVVSSAAKLVPVNDNGVRRVRVGQHSTAPMVTRIVVDLDQVHLYSVRSEGKRVIVSVVAPDKREVARNVPVAATSGNLVGIFHRRHNPAPVTDTPEDTATPTPPPVIAGPAFDPSKEKSSASAVPPSSAIAGPAGQPVAVGTRQPATTPSFEQKQIAVSAAVKPPVTAPVTVPAPVTSSASTPAVSSAPVSPAAASAPSVTTASSVAVPAVKTEAAKPVAAAAIQKPAPLPLPAPEKPAQVETARVSSAPAAVQSSDTPVEIAANAKAEESGVTIAAGPAPETSAEVATLLARGDDPSLHTIFRVKYVAEGVAYLEGGRSQGLQDGMKLEVIDKNVPAIQGDSANAADPRVIAELEVSAVADTSSVTDIHTPKRPVKVGDLAYLSTGDTEALVQQRALSATRQYPAVVSFTEGDTLDEEARQEIPRPPLPSINRARGRIGLDTIETISHGANSITSRDFGMAFRGDITRIGGTYWNLSGYWRGRFTKESVASQRSLQSLINRTYHLNMTYDNPNSSLVAGFGRLYLPWAPSLDTIDGGYFGTRISRGTTLGVFGGSTPDPSSWDYSPDRILSGAFINFEGGEYDGVHYSSTGGGGVSMVKWNVDRPFVF